MRGSALALLLALLPGSASAAPGPASNAVPAALQPGVASALDQRFDILVRDAGLPFAGLVVLDGGGVRYQRLTPGFSVRQPVPIASASKWVAAAVVMTAVDRGELTLDDKVARWIPAAPAPLRDATLRQLVSHTSGMALSGMTEMGVVGSLEESVRRLFARPAARAPGTGFAYGGPSFQVAGLMLEKATGKPFATLFKERLAEPLGMATAKIGSPRSWGTGEVPWVAGGMAMSLDDYARFLAMILNNGRVGARQILSERSVALIETDAVGAIPILFKPQAAPERRYGLGVWCEAPGPDGRCGRASSAGAFGAYPWVDRRTGQAGIFLTRGALPRVAAGAFALRDLAAGAVPGTP